MISVYIAGPFSEALNIRKLRDALALRGVGCTSRWLHEEVSVGKNPGDEKKSLLARMDRYDVRRAQAVVLWNPEGYANKGTGGRHVESGMGFMLTDCPVIIVGAKSNIFAGLPEAVHIPFGHDIDDERERECLVDHLVGEIRARCPDYGPTWDSFHEQQVKQAEEDARDGEEA